MTIPLSSRDRHMDNALRERPAVNGEAMICGRCGAALRPTLRFCTECGQIVAPVATYADLVRPVTGVPTSSQATLTLTPLTETGAHQPTPVPSPAGNKTGGWRVAARGFGVFLMLIALLTVAGGAGIAFRDSSEPLPLVVVALARDSTPTFEPIDQTRSFAPSADAFHLTYFVSGAEPDDRLTAMWVAVDVGDAAPRNTVIDEATVLLTGDDESGAFRLQRGANPWPAGTYRVEVFVNDRRAQRVPYTVEPEP